MCSVSKGGYLPKQLRTKVVILLLGVGSMQEREGHGFCPPSYRLTEPLGLDLLSGCLATFNLHLYPPLLFARTPTSEQAALFMPVAPTANT